MSDIYIDCAGDHGANGIYTPIVGGYENSSNINYTLTTNGSYWEINSDSYSAPQLLYRLYQDPISDPVSLTDWEIIGGASPAPKSALGDYPNCAAVAEEGYNVYRKDNVDYIYKSGNNFYIRKS